LSPDSSGLKIIIEALSEGLLKLDEKELIWIDMLQRNISEIPLVEDKFIEIMLPQIENQIIPSEYGI